MKPRRSRVCSSVLIGLLSAGSFDVQAGAALGLFNPFNHGFFGVDELGTDRVEIAHVIMFPRVGSLEDTDYINFTPFYRAPATQVYQNAQWGLENYESYATHHQNPFQSSYRNLHINPTSGLAGTFGYFDPIEQLSSSQGSPGFTPRSGQILTSAHVDTGIGSAEGVVRPNGEIALKVDVQRSGGPGETPVAEGALQGTYTDRFTLSGPAPTAEALISFSARANAPSLDFSDGDFYNYAVGYQMAVFERVDAFDLDEDGNPVGPPRPGIKEYWGDNGFYWMDARLLRAPITGLPDTVHIESLGEPPPGVEGVDFQKEAIDFFPTFGDTSSDPMPSAYKYIRELPYDLFNPLVYDDPMIPFERTTESGQYAFNPLTDAFEKVGEISLPTGVELELVVNFFVIAGCSDQGFETCEISIDGSHTAGFGIRFTDPNVSLLSESGFDFPATAAVPIPGPLVLLLSGLGVLGGMRQRRRL